MKGADLIANIRLASVVLAFLMLAGGMFFLYGRARGGQGWSHLFGLVLLVPTILVLAVTDSVSKDMLGVLLGGVAGYVFGRAGQDG